MSFHYGQATDYLDLLDLLIDFCTLDSIVGAAVNSGGSGYAVDDIVAVNGGTATLTAQLRVTSVSGGAITGVRIEKAGAYSVRPTLTANAVTTVTGSGSSATIDLTITTQLTGVAINNGGSGYSEGNILTVNGGTSTTAATIRVTSVDGSGVITGVEIANSGSYTVNPTLTANTVSGGDGSSATMDLTMGTNGWSINREQTYDTTENEVQFQGVGSGGDQIYVGIRTYRDAGPDIFNWELAGMSGFNSGSAWDLQPGISPGRQDAASVEDGGAYIPLDDSTINFWFNVNGRRIIVVAKPTAGTGYQQAYLGFYDSYATAAELPYPIIVAGSTSHRNTRFNSTRANMNGLATPTGKLRNIGIFNGPMMFRFSDGVWYSVFNDAEIYNSGNETSSAQRWVTAGVITPPAHTLPGVPSSTDPSEGVLENQNLVHWLSIVPLGGSTEYFSMRDTPETPNFEVPLFPGTILTTKNHTNILEQIIGVLNDVRWVPVGGSSVVSEDLITDGSDIYIAFQGGNKTGNNDYTAIRIN